MSDKEYQSDRCYVDDYSTAQSQHARLAAETVEKERKEDVYAAQGMALGQVKDFARIGFMLVPGATTEGFEQLWAMAFQVKNGA